MIKVLTAKAHANGPIISPRSDAVSSVRNREAHIVAVPVDILKPLARDLLPSLIGRTVMKWSKSSPRRRMPMPRRS